MNISRIGQEQLFNTSDSDTSGGLSSLISSIGNEIEGDINDQLSDLAGSIAQELGMEDFYSVHLLDYCEGTFTPGPVPNATLSSHDIHRNVSSCSNRTSMFTFDPTQAIERSINNSAAGQDASSILNKVHWPQELEDGVKALHIAFKAMFVLYCIAIGLSFLCLLLSIGGLVSPSGHRGLPFINVMVFLLAFLTMAVASAISTAVSEKGTDVVNKYGKAIGVSANVGHKYMGITWGASGALFLGSLLWCIGCIAPGRKNKYVHKTG